MIPENLFQAPVKFWHSYCPLGSGAAIPCSTCCLYRFVSGLRFYGMNPVSVLFLPSSDVVTGAVYRAEESVFLLLYTEPVFP